MKFGNLFSRNHQLTSSNQHPPLFADNYQSDYTFDMDISSEITRRLLIIINDNINKDVSQFGVSVMNPSMLADLSRMNYYINSNKISVPGVETASKINYSTHIMEPKNHWIQENIGSLSSFLHQGIFADFFGAAGPWKSTNNQIWEIAMVSLDRNNTENDFYISNTGVIKIISQARVKNVMLRKGGIVLADARKSYFSLQLSFRVIHIHGKCRVTSLSQGVDHCRLHICGQGLM
ncbi:hypothetical protein GE278_13420 [Enterobacteriaceae bacterium Kacie_13]|nr:hypothetical protein GE278_13420 [Enterobacteriaceae bacterium Kacie_13]